MYKILVVEDEMIERNYIIKTIEQCDYAFERILSAKNGEEGLALFKEYKPEIVISDIQMPILDGLSMFEEIKKIKSNTVCLLLSSYDYFTYAQMSLRIGVEDYILKPSNKAMINAKLISATQKVKQMQNTLMQEKKLLDTYRKLQKEIEYNCFTSILTLKDEKKIQENLKLLNIKADYSFCMIAKNISMQEMENVNQLIQDNGFSCIYHCFTGYCIAFVFSNYTIDDNDILSLVNSVKKRLNYTLIYGKLVSDVSKLYDSYDDAYLRIKRKSKKKIERKQLNLKEMLVECIVHNKTDGLSTISKKIYNEHPIHEVKQMFEHVLMDAIDILNTKHPYNLEAQYLIVNEVEVTSYLELECYVINSYHTILKAFKAMKNVQTLPYYRKAISYIETHFKDPISLNDVAKELDITPHYLSRLIHKVNNEGFSDIVNKYRIEEAKKMIRKGLPFKIIVREVGFGSQSYFTKLFKKKVGLSPGEYKSLFH